MLYKMHIPLLLLYMRIQQIKTIIIIINRIPTTAPTAAMYSILKTPSPIMYIAYCVCIATLICVALWL